jgi:hypothetical protein
VASSDTPALVSTRLHFLYHKDILEWLKFVQGETDGIKLDLAKLAAALGADAASVAD